MRARVTLDYVNHVAWVTRDPVSKKTKQKSKSELGNVARGHPCFFCPVCLSIPTGLHPDDLSHPNHPRDSKAHHQTKSHLRAYDRNHTSAPEALDGGQSALDTSTGRLVTLADHSALLTHQHRLIQDCWGSPSSTTLALASTSCYITTICLA